MTANFLTPPAPHTEGAAFIRSKPALTRAVFNALAPDLQARAFVVTGVECLDTVARVRELTARLPLGEDYDDLKSQILSQLSPWLITADPSDPEELRKQTAAASRRAEMLLRMHGWQAYAQTQDALMRANEDVFPYRMYLSSEDARVRPTHAALNKKIIPADHPFWQNHTPPWEFNCRCDCVPMTQEEVDELRDSEQSLPPEDRQVLPPEALAQIEDNARLVKPGGQGFLDLRTPREKSPNGSGYEFRPAENALDIDQILRAAGGFFIPDQGFQSDEPAYCATIIVFHCGFAAFLEGHAVDPCEDLDFSGFPPDFDNE
jgi:SPP1 gp7 family putative phage head morphogenesis protein